MKHIKKYNNVDTISRCNFPTKLSVYLYPYHEPTVKSICDSRSFAVRKYFDTTCHSAYTNFVIIYGSIYIAAPTSKTECRRGEERQDTGRVLVNVRRL